MTVVLFRFLRFFLVDEREAVGRDDGCDAGSMSGREEREAGVVKRSDVDGECVGGDADTVAV